MKCKSLSFLVLISILIPLAAHAQAAVSLSSLQVALWPEYDRSSMLVIYRIQLPQDTPLPVSLSFRIPAGAGRPNAVAVMHGDGLVSVDYDMAAEGDWSRITFISDSLTAQLEYYDPALVIDGSRRSYSYSWPGDYAVEDLLVEVQQPGGASHMVFTPALGQQQKNEDGLTYHSQDFGALPAGRSFTFSLEYDNSTEILTSPQSTPSQPPVATRPVFNYGRWLLVMAAVVLIYRVWQRRSFTEEPKRGRQQTGKAVVLCHKCGHQASPGDKFCRECGTKLRG
jgi:hypothetical protein